jgi:hypothetical protein
MLPKFRPASLGRDAQARPSIRPVRPSPPPPPPTPPRKNHPSGFGPRGGAEAAEVARQHHEQFEVATSPGLSEPLTTPGRGEPSTLSRGGPETVPIDRALQNAREAHHGRARANAVLATFDDETQARPLDDRHIDKMRREQLGQAPPPADLAVAYDSLPSLEVRPVYDTYEAEFSERDPVTKLQGAHESAQVRRAPRAEPSYKEPSYKEAPVSYSDAEPPSFLRPSLPDSFPVNDAQAQGDQGNWGRREESGPRERPLPDAARSYAAPVPTYDDPSSDSDQWGRDRAEPPTGFSSMPAPRAEIVSYEQPPIPQAPRVPDEMRPQFVVGVQPLRGAPTEAYGTPRVHTPGPQQMSPMQAMAPYGQPQQQYAPPYAPAAQYPQHQQYQPQQPLNAIAASPRALTPYPGTPYPGHMQAPMLDAGMSPSMQMRAQPVGSQLAPATPNKVGRFAWFVAGAAFGITFAFFATGFFTGKPKATSTDFPAAPSLTVTAPAATAPAATAPAAITPATTVVPPVAVTPAVVPAVAPPVAVVPAVAPVAPPVAPAVIAPPAAVRPAPPPPAPVRPRAQAPRRPAAPAAPAVPRSIGGGGGDDEAPAPRSAPPAPPSGDLGDLLGAGLKP